MKITIDGKDFTKFVGGLEDFNLSFSLNTTDNSTSVSVSKTLEFTGEAFEYLYGIFFEDPKNSVGDIVGVNIYLECCNQDEEPIAFYMDHSSVQICDCGIEGNLIKVEDDSQCRAYLRDKVYWKDNGFLDAVPFYDVPYCEEGTVLKRVWSVIHCIISPILVVLEIIEEVINGILNAIDFLVFWKDLDWEVDIPSLDDSIDLIQACGRKHPSPRIVDILTYNANRCGLEFDSKVLQSHLPNILLLQAAFEEGCEDCNYIEDNLLNKTTIQLMNDLKPVFNAEYRIIDGVLYFDWIKRIEQVLQENVLVDVERVYELGDADDPPCYDFDTTLPAYMRFEYGQDAIDQAGNKRMSTYRADGEQVGNYKEIIEWNDPPNEYQKGEQSVFIPFSAPAYTDDGKTDCVATVFRKAAGFNQAVDPHQLVLTSGMSSLPKLLLAQSLDNGFDPFRSPTGEQRGCLDPCGSGAGFVYDVYEYGPFLWTNENVFEALYRRYYSIDDPRGGERKMINLQTFKFAFDCQQLQMVMKYGVNLAVKTRYGFGYPSNIMVNFDDNTITVTGVKV